MHSILVASLIFLSTPAPAYAITPAPDLASVQLRDGNPLICALFPWLPDCR